MFFLNLLTLTLACFQLTHIFSRVFVPKTAQYILYWAVFLCCFYFLYFIANRSFFFYKYYFSKKSPSKIQKIFFRIKEKIFYYLDVDFVQKFLSNYLIIDFYLNMLFFQKRANSLDYLLKVSFLILWLVFIFCFFFELLSGETFLLSLYALSFSFLTRKLIQLFSWLARIKFSFLINCIKVTHFDLLLDNAFEFFINNKLLINAMFFTEPSLANKKMLSFLWITYAEIHYYHSLYSSMMFFEKNRQNLETFLIKCNKKLIILIFFTKIFLIFPFYNFIYLFISLSWFFMFFLILRDWLVFLAFDSGIGGYQSFSHLIQTKTEWFNKTKKNF